MVSRQGCITQQVRHLISVTEGCQKELKQDMHHFTESSLVFHNCLEDQQVFKAFGGCHSRVVVALVLLTLILP